LKTSIYNLLADDIAVSIARYAVRVMNDCNSLAKPTKLPTLVAQMEGFMQKRAIIASMLLLGACSNNSDNDGATKEAKPDVAKTQAARAAIDITPGLWETTIRFSNIEAKGMPDAVKTQMLKATGGAITVKSCITKEQTDKPDSDFFGAAEGSNCSFDTLEKSGDQMKVSMTCKPDGKTTIKNSMSGTITKDSYDMDMQQSTMGTPMGDMNMTGKISAKRLGECPA
jgi:Protein of unknown function (DUF3617)